MQINLFTKASAIVLAWRLGIGIAEKYFVKLSCMVRTYKLPDFVLVSGPTMYIDIF